MEAQQAKCPKCHAIARHQTAIRQKIPSFVDVGWRCNACGYEWGFEILTEKEDE